MSRKLKGRAQNRGSKNVALQAGDLVCFTVQPDARLLPEGWQARVTVMQIDGFDPALPHKALASHRCSDCGSNVSQWFDAASELVFLQRCSRH